MNKINNFLNKNGILITIIITLLLLLQTCSIKTSIKGVKKEIKKLEYVYDSNSNAVRREIKIEGLKSEKRMIQATDRRLMDLNRQTEIDNEIKKLEN